MTLRQANLSKLDKKPFDVLIVGGGINGAVSAAALSAQGCSVALIDRGDFGGLTSQSSSNLVWGGIKYMENFEFPLVWKLCASRNRLLRSYPANIREIRFYSAIPQGYRWPSWMMYGGTSLYWLFGRLFTRMPRLLTLRNMRKEEPIIRTEAFTGGVEYSDAYLVDNDARFVFNFVRGALNSGAIAVNYVELLEAKRQGELWTARVRDVDLGVEMTVQARVLLNAAGPYVDAVNQKNGVQTAHRHVFSKGIHLVVRRLAQAERVLTFFEKSGRMYFVIPMGACSVIGTTDTPVDQPETRVTAADRAYVLANINPCLRLDQPLTQADIIAERCGVRPLVVDASAAKSNQEWFALSRKHEIDLGDHHLSIFGGKLTDCLNVGEEVVEIVSKMGIPMKEKAECWYGEAPDSTCQEFFRQARLMHLDELRESDTHEKLSTRLWRRYGIRAFFMLEQIRRQPGMEEVLIKGSQYLRCELYHAATIEMVTRLDDFLRRRSKIALVIPRDELKQARGLDEAARILFQDDAQRRLDEYFAMPPV